MDRPDDSEKKEDGAGGKQGRPRSRPGKASVGSGRLEAKEEARPSTREDSKAPSTGPGTP